MQKRLTRRQEPALSSSDLLLPAESEGQRGAFPAEGHDPGFDPLWRQATSWRALVITHRLFSILPRATVSDITQLLYRKAIDAARAVWTEKPISAFSDRQWGWGGKAQRMPSRFGMIQRRRFRPGSRMSRFYPYGCYSLVAGVARPAVAGAGCIESCGSAGAYPVVILQSGRRKSSPLDKPVQIE